MEAAEFVRALDREGGLLALAAEEAGTGAEVPTCPGWTVGDLVRHTGAVHRWATAFVSERITAPRRLDVGTEPDGDAVLAWFRTGHRRLVDTLAAAPSDLDCWRFLPAPTPLAFWARRQAHETAVHRVDAEAARGGTHSALAPAFAADGVDELLRGFHARPGSRVRSARPRVLRVRATDLDDAVWTVRLSSESPATVVGALGDADCEVSGTAEELYLALWNRAPFPAVTGDGSLAGLWRAHSAVT